MRIINIEDLRRLAKKRLPKAVFEFVDGAAHDERTLAANRRDFEQIWFAPHVLVDVGDRRQAVRVLGQQYSSPFVMGPTGLAGMLWPDGDIATARATAKAGVGYCLSTNSNCSIEQVAARGRRDFWFQLYLQRDRELARALLDRARAAGCPVLCVTVDLPIQGPRERDERNGFTVPPRLDLENIFDFARHVGWLWRMATGPRIAFANLERDDGRKSKLTTVAQHIAEQFDPTVTWKEIDWLKSIWGGAMAVKGILRPDDARLAAQHGVDAVIVSNHGGRQLDSASSAVSALPAIADAVGGRVEVLIDGGIRRGSDIVKALALGARACLVGRASLYGLAANGEAGVSRAIEILMKEIDITLALLGQPDVAKLNRSALTPGAGTAFWAATP
jgi:L-lactate dehydrogenase (cytochrome)